jgi:hypothetical protein
MGENPEHDREEVPGRPAVSPENMQRPARRMHRSLGMGPEGWRRKGRRVTEGRRSGPGGAGGLWDCSLCSRTRRLEWTEESSRGGWSLASNGGQETS